MRLALAVVLLAASASAGAGAGAQDQVDRFLGYAYELDSGRYAFTEIVEQRSDGKGQWLDGHTTYLLPDGRQLARKTLNFSKDPFVPTYWLEHASGFGEGITAVDDRITMERRAGDDKRTAYAPRDGLVTADAGLPRLLRANFDALLADQTLKVRVVAPLRLDTYRFKARRIADGTFEGKRTIRIEVDLGSLLTVFARPLEFAFDPDSKRLLEFRGMTNLVNPATKEPYSVRISYFTARPKDAPELPRASP